MKINLEINTSTQNIIELFRFLDIDVSHLNIKLDTSIIPELLEVDTKVQEKEDNIAEILFSYFHKKFGLTKEEIKGKVKKRDLVLCRTYFSIFMLRQFKYISLKKIGNYLGGRDHSTIINLRDNYRDECETNKSYYKTSEKVLFELETLINLYQNEKSKETVLA